MDPWLESFYRGERSVMEHVYRKHYADVDHGASRVLRGADRETVVQEVFFQMISSEPFRRNFRGGELGAWLQRVAVNQAVSHVRRYRRETSLPTDDAERLLEQPGPLLEEQAEARQFLDRFRRQVLPEKWARVFELCFVQGLDQRTAAEQLGTSRTTLAYQWLRIKWLLEKFAREASGG